MWALKKHDVQTVLILTHKQTSESCLDDLYFVVNFLLAAKVLTSNMIVQKLFLTFNFNFNSK